MFLELKFDAESIPGGFQAIRDLSGELRAISGRKFVISQKVSTWSLLRIHTNLGYDCNYIPRRKEHIISTIFRHKTTSFSIKAIPIRQQREGLLEL